MTKDRIPAALLSGRLPLLLMNKSAWQGDLFTPILRSRPSAQAWQGWGLNDFI